MKKAVNRNTIGMFNIAKGIGMLGVIWVHTMEQFPILMGGNVFWGAIWKVAATIGMPIFCVISGYGFRKTSMKKCFAKQAKTTLIPYALTSVAAVILFFCVHFASFRWLPGTIGETQKVFWGFLLGLPVTTSIMGHEIYSCGPIWFLLALYWGWCLLNFVCEKIPENRQMLAVAVIAAIAWGLGMLPIQLFGIPQGMSACLFFYIGNIAKKKKLFLQNSTFKMKAAMLGSFLGCMLLILLGKEDSMYSGVWALGPISMLMDGILSIGAIKILLQMNRLSGWFIKILAQAGMLSLYIFCVHTVEFRAIPWYLIAAFWSERPVLGMLVTYLCRFAAVFYMSKLISILKSLNSGVNKKEFV